MATRKRISASLALCFSLALSLAITAPRLHAQKPPAPVFFTIDVPGAAETDANDINANGLIVGFDCMTSLCANGGIARAWVQINPTTFKFLKPPGSTQAFAYGINDSNTVVGWYFDSAGVEHGFSFTKGTYKKIDPPGSTFTNAWSINSAGTIVGTYVGSDGLFHGFTLSGTTYTTFNAPNGATLTELTGIDNTGTNMVGIYIDTAGQQHGFQLANGTTFTTIDPPGSNTTASDRINDSGTVVGLFCTGSCVQNVGPYSGYQKKGTTFTKVNFPIATETRCRGVNNAGTIVGRYTDSAGTIHGMMVLP